MNAFGAWALARLKEPSTAAGLAALVAGMTFLPHAAEIAALVPGLVAGLVAALGLVAMIRPERGGK